MKLADRIVELMLTGKPGEVWQVRAVAAALEVPRGEVTDAVSKLRYAGKVDWQKLKLAPSLWIGREKEMGEAVIAMAAKPAGDGVSPAAKSPAYLQEKGAGDRAAVANAAAADAPAGAAIPSAAPVPSPDPVRKSVTKRSPRQGSVEPASRPAAGRSAAAASETMDATGGETPPAPPVTSAARETPVSADVPAAPSLAQQVHDEAIAAGRNRQAARRLSGTSAAKVAMPLREQVDRAFLAEPVDALSLLRRRWPALLDELVSMARGRGQPVAETVRDVIEGGLAQLAAEGGR